MDFTLIIEKAPILANFEGERAKKMLFEPVFSKFSKLFTRFFFFKNFACGAENLAKTASFYCFRRAQKINLVDLEKKVVKIFEKPQKHFAKKN